MAHATRIPSLLLAGALACAGLLGQAPKHTSGQMLADAVKVQEQRATELDGIALWAGETSRTMASHALNSKAHAGRMRALAAEYRNSAAALPDSDFAKKDLLDFSNELDTFAENDAKLGDKQDELARNLLEQEHSAQSAAKYHRDSAAKLKALASKGK